MFIHLASMTFRLLTHLGQTGPMMARFGSVVFRIFSGENRCR